MPDLAEPKTRETQKVITDLLCKADRRLGKSLYEMLPAPFKMRVNDHDTGQIAVIWAEADGLPSIDVWRGSVWYSSRYEFNDEQNPPGFAEGQEWAIQALEDFFGRVKVAFEADETQREATSRKYREETEKQKSLAMKVYAAMLSGETP